MAGAEPRAGRFDAWFVGGLAFALYLALGQSTLYGIDAWDDLRRLADGDSRSAVHVLYRPLAAWFGSWGQGLGLSLHESVRMFSAVGAALGVVCVGAASRVLGASRGESFWIALWVAVAPSMLFYATVAERHGPFFAFAGLAAYCAARSVTNGGLLWAVALSVAIGLAYGAHSTGVLLVALFVPWVASERVQRDSAWLRDSLVVVFGSAAAGFAMSRIAIATGQLTEATGNFDILGEYASVAIQHVDHAPIVLWGEYLLPLMPISLLWIVRWWGPGGACVGASLGIGVGVYLVFAFLVLAGFYAREGFGEFGAYLLPLAWPLAHVAVTHLDRRIVVVGVPGLLRPRRRRGRAARPTADARGGRATPCRRGCASVFVARLSLRLRGAFRRVPGLPAVERQDR